MKKEEYDKYKQSADEEIRKLSEKLSALGIFSFSKKKELNARINGLQEHTVELKRDFDTSERTYYSLVWWVLYTSQENKMCIKHALRISHLRASTAPHVLSNALSWLTLKKLPEPAELALLLAIQGDNQLFNITKSY